MPMDIPSIINAVKNAQLAVSAAKGIIDQFKGAGVVMTTDSEAAVEAEIKKLEDMLPELRQATQEKLRGTKKD